MTEELTSEERALLATHPDWTHEAKLLRLYDAALARAEAEERENERAQSALFRIGIPHVEASDGIERLATRCATVETELKQQERATQQVSAALLDQRGQDIEQYKDRLFAAESALAEATALLAHRNASIDALSKKFLGLSVKFSQNPDVCLVYLEASREVFALGKLSATPAPAATVDASGDALRARVAELEASARDVARAVADLQRTLNNECGLRVQATDAAFKLQTRISRAVAELETTTAFLPKHLTHNGVIAALAILKGEGAP